MQASRPMTHSLQNLRLQKRSAHLSLGQADAAGVGLNSTQLLPQPPSVSTQLKFTLLYFLIACLGLLLKSAPISKFKIHLTIQKVGLQYDTITENLIYTNPGRKSKYFKTVV